MLVGMKTTLFALAALALTAAATPAADPPKGAALDTSFLKLFAETRGFTLGRPQKPKFTPDGKFVLFLRAGPKTPTQTLFEFDLATGKSREILSPSSILKGGDENLTPEEKARRERQRVSTGGFADFHLNPDGTRVLVALSGKLWVLERPTEKVTQLQTGPGSIVDPKWSPDGKLVAYVRDHDVCVYDLAAGKESAVTTGGTATKTHGLAEFVAQEEMGRHTGYWWSPDSKFIAYAEADHTGVEQWHVADPFRPGTPPTPQFYPRPGKKNVAVRLGVIPVTGGKTVWMEWDRKQFEYLARVVFGNSGMLLVLQSRDQKAMGFTYGDTTTGVVGGGTIHYAVEDRAWFDLPPDTTALPGGRGFVVGTPNSSLLPAPGPATRPFNFMTLTFQADGLAVGWTGVGGSELLAFDPVKRDAIFLDRTDPTEQHVFRNDGRVKERQVGTRLTTEPGVHTAAVSKDQSHIVTTSTTLKAMPVSKVMVTEGASLGTLPSVAVEPPFLPNVTVQKVGDFWTAVVRPRNFDPKKKYPVLVDVYGGPKHLRVVQAMRNWLIPQWLADQGFVVVAIDNRGTPGRGREWERAIYQKFGTVPLEDQAKGLLALCDTFPELDRDRVGIVGWSFGGYMAANGVLRRPDVFKAAVAGAPVTDWEDYDTHYTERYMGLLPESRAAYDEASLIPLAKDLKRPLLLVSGTADDNVYFRHTLKLTDALFRAGRDFEVLPLPGVTHMYAGDPQVTERLWAKAVAFFKAHLGGPK
jgi:dipeptidyl-peptidase-4